MFVKVLFWLALVGTVMSSSIKGYKVPEEDGPSLYEVPCSTVGGLCFKQDECPEGKQAPRGFCPLQQDQGVECCFSAVPRSVTSCRANGGECMPLSWNCPASLLYSKASDCGHQERCCILIK